eukprot:Gb_31619 [translate_table: standard]
MNAEYFPPKEYIVRENETPIDIYILVSGEVVVEALGAGDMFGEIGILCDRPQPLIVRTRKLSQLLRLSRTVLLDKINAHHLNKCLCYAISSLKHTDLTARASSITNNKCKHPQYLFQRAWPPFWKRPNTVEGHMKDSARHMRRICWVQVEMENASERDPPKKRLDGSSPVGFVSCGEAMDVRKTEK